MQKRNTKMFKVRKPTEEETDELNELTRESGENIQHMKE